MSFSNEQLAALKAKLDPSHVAKRQQSGRALSYIEGWHAEAEANRIFGFDAWHSEVIETRLVAERERKLSSGKDGWSVSYVCTVRVTVYTPDGGKVVRDGVGAGHGIDADLGLAHESAIKEAATDAEKRALKTFGNPFGLALYDKTQANVGAPEAPAERNAPTGRKTAAAAKRDGEDVKIKGDIGKADLTGLLDWDTHFDEWTAHLPLSWLDSIRDMILLRREELLTPPPEGAAEMDAAFRETVGRPSPPAVSGVGRASDLLERVQ